MRGISIVLFIICAIFFIGMIHFLLESKRPGVYPPRHVLKKRAVTLAAGGVIFFLFGLLFSLFS
ncbi:MAG: hypothetical protein Q8934_04890 [Bacillota bacterium]|nr:hypothetical protein [Bacillota bacterium]